MSSLIGLVVVSESGGVTASPFSVADDANTVVVDMLLLLLLPLSVIEVIIEVAADANVVVKRAASFATVSVQGQLEIIDDW